LSTWEVVDVQQRLDAGRSQTGPVVDRVAVYRAAFRRVAERREQSQQQQSLSFQLPQPPPTALADLTRSSARCRNARHTRSLITTIGQHIYCEHTQRSCPNSKFLSPSDVGYIDSKPFARIIMRPSSLGGGRILRRTLSVRLSVRPSRYCYRASRRAT